MKLNEQNIKKIDLYKFLLASLLGYVTNNVGTSVDLFYDKVLERGAKVLPSAKKEKQILEFVIFGLTTEDAPVKDSVTALMSDRFTDLCDIVKPYYKAGRSKKVAFYNKGGKVSDKILDLLDFDDQKGFWCDFNGEKVNLISE